MYQDIQQLIHAIQNQMKPTNGVEFAEALAKAEAALKRLAPFY